LHISPSTISGYYQNGHSYGGNRNTYQKRYPQSSPFPHPYLTEKSRGSLNQSQIRRLQDLLNEQYVISSKDEQLSIQVTSAEIILRLKKKLLGDRIPLMKGGMRLVGSGAAYVVADKKERDINDLDFSFYVSIGKRFLDILKIEEDLIRDLLIEQSKIYLTPREIYEKFFLDSLKVENEKENWSLVTWGKKKNQTIDIKFVHKSRRSYVFSSDSFEVILDPLFVSKKQKYKNGNHHSEPYEYKIQVESMYGNYEEALIHLKEGLLCTNQPEELRRGIFRYCYELAKGKLPRSEKDRNEMDKIFTDSFFAEKDLPLEDILSKFLNKHTSNAASCLDELFKIISHSSYPEKDKYCDIINKMQELYKSNDQLPVQITQL